MAEFPLIIQVDGLEYQLSKSDYLKIFGMHIQNITELSENESDPDILDSGAVTHPFVWLARTVMRNLGVKDVSNITFEEQGLSLANELILLGLLSSDSQDDRMSYILNK